MLLIELFHDNPQLRTVLLQKKKKIKEWKTIKITMKLCILQKAFQ
jgi:hypothetical protein